MQNLEYARQLLLSLETSYATIKSSAARKAVQEDLFRWKNAIRKLNERLHLVEEMEGEEEEGQEEEETKSTPASIAKPSTSPPLSASSVTTAATSEPHLRNRFAPAANPLKPTTTPLPPDPAPAPTSAPSQQDLDHLLATHSHEQSALTTSLLALSRQLKESSLNFQHQLESEKPYLELAAQGLDKNVAGMQATGSKLNKVSNDRLGWYKTLINIAIIIVLGVVGLIILMLPKLRR